MADGKPLTQAERALLQAKAASTDDTSLIAKNYEQLADLLGVNVCAVNRWRKLAGAPQPLEDGSLRVIEWRQFVRANNLRTACSPQTEALKARKLLAEVEERELKVAIRKKEYVPLHEVREVWTRQVGLVRSLMEARLLNELPPILAGKNAVGREGALRDLGNPAHRRGEDALRTSILRGGTHGSPNDAVSGM